MNLSLIEQQNILLDAIEILEHYALRPGKQLFNALDKIAYLSSITQKLQSKEEQL